MIDINEVARSAPPFQILPELPPWEYEALKESIRRHGVLLPVVKDEQGATIDGHHRERACRELGIADFPVMTLARLSEPEKRDHALLLNLVRRKLTRRQLREIIAAEVRRTPELSNNWLGSVLGVSKNTVASVRVALEQAGEVVKLTTFKGRDGKKHPATKVLTHRAVDAERARQALEVLGEDAPRKPLELRLVERRAFKKKRRERILGWQAQKVDDEDIRLFHSDFRQLQAVADIRPATIDLVLADTPYGREFVPHLGDLADFTSRVLREGGVFCCYIGVEHLPVVLEEFRRYLEYQCLGFSSWNGKWSFYRKNSCLLQATPVVIFSKGKWSRQQQWYNHIHRSRTDCEKDWHDWQKAESDIRHWVMALSDVNDLVCDPLAGSFTTAVACRQLNRRFVGCDLDEANVIAGRQRLAEVASISQENSPTIISAP